MIDLRPRDGFRVAATPRYRASRRHRLRDSARQGMILVAVCALLGCAWNVPFHPDALPLIIGLNAALFAIAAVGYRALGAVASRRPEVVVFLVLVAVDGAIVALGLGHEALGLLAVGYLLLLPVVVSLMVPWATAVHMRWLGVHVMFALGLLLFATDGMVAGADRDQLFGLLVVAIVVSQTGHVKGVRGQVAAFTQIQQIRALNRAARRDHTRLDRLLAVTAQAAVTDPLTGLGNRLALTAAFELARSRIERHRDSYGLLMLDLDGFKAINDERGHRAGDEVLQEVAHAIRRVLRPGDHAFRYGGEEFVVLLRLDVAGDALAVGERVRQAVEDLAIPNAGNLPFGHLTISVGVTALGPNEGPAVEEMWLARADAALYRAKSTGRNRCETGTAEVSSSVARISSIPEDRSSGAEGALVVGVPSTVGAEG